MNALSVRRVLIQTIDENGKPEGEPMYGVTACDDYGRSYLDIWTNIDDLNKDIEKAGCILGVLPDWKMEFDTADFEKVGTDNFYGTDWEVNED